MALKMLKIALKLTSPEGVLLAFSFLRSGNGEDTEAVLGRVEQEGESYGKERQL